HRPKYMAGRAISQPDRPSRDLKGSESPRIVRARPQDAITHITRNPGRYAKPGGFPRADLHRSWSFRLFSRRCAIAPSRPAAQLELPAAWSEVPPGYEKTGPTRRSDRPVEGMTGIEPAPSVWKIPVALCVAPGQAGSCVCIRTKRDLI